MKRFKITSACAIQLLALSWTASIFGLPEGPPKVLGMPPEQASQLPGYAALFELHTASETPRILDEEYAPGELVARFQLTLSDLEVESLAIAAGAAEVERLSPLGLFLIKGPTSTDALQEVMNLLWESKNVVTIDANYTGGGVIYSPNDPIYTNGGQWYLESLSDIDIDMSSAWDITRGSSSVVVAVIDSGLLMSHPEFSGRIYENLAEIGGVSGVDDDTNGYVDDFRGWDIFNLDGDPSDDADAWGGQGHGSWVASVLLANSNNSHQIAGVDHFAKILPIRALPRPLVTSQISHITAGMDYVIATAPLAKVVNMSFAGYNKLNLTLNTTLAFMAQQAILITGSGNSFSSGGGRADQFNPAGHPDVITVSGTDEFDQQASFSDTGNSVNFAAPSVNIHTCSFSAPLTSNTSTVGSGTSFSAPIVSGIASLALALRPTFTREELICALRETVVDLGTLGHDVVFGWGRVNAHQALQAVPACLFWDGFERGDTSRWDQVFP